jgi:hypothetical protein
MQFVFSFFDLFRGWHVDDGDIHHGTFSQQYPPLGKIAVGLFKNLLSQRLLLQQRPEVQYRLLVFQGITISKPLRAGLSFLVLIDQAGEALLFIGKSSSSSSQVT